MRQRALDKIKKARTAKLASQTGQSSDDIQMKGAPFDAQVCILPLIYYTLIHPFFSAYLI
ncbi:hypothetical protein AOQ84DRAFT_351865 [Glonium stellatum]|uniref:Uncharacterized protein n=1 Tax=Glonium stellatum TaxID=574774 RepID=A0A8E2FB30_9PEZI|nr:hypothetical protein AOQ84DRAFT_351865 [Glonium stellatum]